MTIPVIKIKVTPKPVIKGRMDVRFPARVEAQGFITVSKANGVFTFGVDFDLLGQGFVTDPTQATVAYFDTQDGAYKTASFSDLVAGATQIEQHITAAGPVAILPNAGIVRVDQAVGAAITLTLPLASAKTCPVLISDWRGDAGTNPITVNLSGSDKFPGGLTSWTIAADTASIFARPISGVGYAL